MPFTLFLQRESSSAIPAFLPEAKIIESKTQSPSSHTPRYSGRPPAEIAPLSASLSPEIAAFPDYRSIPFAPAPTLTAI